MRVRIELDGDIAAETSSAVAQDVMGDVPVPAPASPKKGRQLIGEKRRVGPEGTEKRCPKCSTFKLMNAENFPRRTSSPDGFGDWCLVCHRAANNELGKRRRRGDVPAEPVIPQPYDSPITVPVDIIEITPSGREWSPDDCICHRTALGVIVPGVWHDAGCPLHRHRWVLPSSSENGVYVGICSCGERKDHRPGLDHQTIEEMVARAVSP